MKAMPHIRTAALICTALFAASAMASASDLATGPAEYRHGDVEFEGYFAWDDSREGKLPGVLVIHEWWGHNEFARQKAEELAGLGYVAFALDMYGKGVKTDDPAEAQRLSRQFYRGDFDGMRERAQAGLDQLAAHEKVDPDRLAVIGFCFGGTVALQLGYSAPSGLQAVVSFHGALIPPAEEDDENIRASILVLHGADDPLVPPEQVDTFKRAMRRSGADWQLISYGNAVHSFTNPEADAREIPGVAYNADAARRSWKHMQMFFDEKLGEPAPMQEERTSN